MLFAALMGACVALVVAIAVTSIRGDHARHNRVKQTMVAVCSGHPVEAEYVKTENEGTWINVRCADDSLHIIWP